MRSMDPDSGSELWELAVAINYYMSTGDEMGDCMAVPTLEGEIMVAIIHDPYDPADADDFRRFSSRIGEIAIQGKIPVRLEERAPILGGKSHLLVLPFEDITKLTRERVLNGGAAGFGSLRAEIVAKHGAVLQTIGSGWGAHTLIGA